MNAPSTSSPYRRTSAESIRVRTASPDSAVPVTGRQDSDKITTWYLARRLHLVIQDLGLLDHVPSDWTQPGPDGLSFRRLTVGESDRFVLAMEDLALGRLNHQPSPGTNQLPLF